MHTYTHKCIHVHTLAVTHTHNIHTTSALCIYVQTCALCTHIEIEREKCPWWMLVIEHIHELPKANAHIHVFINVHMHTFGGCLLSSTCMNFLKQMHTYVCLSMCTCTHLCTHIHMHTHLHTQRHLAIHAKTCPLHSILSWNELNDVHSPNPIPKYKLPHLILLFCEVTVVLL